VQFGIRLRHETLVVPKDIWHRQGVRRG